MGIITWVGFVWGKSTQPLKYLLFCLFVWKCAVHVATNDGLLLSQCSQIRIFDDGKLYLLLISPLISLKI